MSKNVKISFVAVVVIFAALYMYARLSAPLKTLNRVSGAIEATMDKVDEEQADKLIDSLNTKMGEAGDKIDSVDLDGLFDKLKKKGDTLLEEIKEVDTGLETSTSRRN